jgi:ABC-type Mn2+/Zn2+ transport system permease subunit
MITNLIILILVAVLLGASAGYLGSFMVLKRMSLVGDALSHVALPGMAVALLLHQNPILGAFIALAAAIFGIWCLQQNSTVYPDALVGIFFTASLAIGLLITPETELLEALFGNIQNLGLLEAAATLLISALVIILTRLISRRLTLNIISEDLAKTAGFSGKYTSLVYLLLVGVVVALGVKFVGTLLTGALVIIPAASAKNISRSLTTYTLWSALFGLISAVLGVAISYLFGLPSGPVTILSGIAIFILSLGIKRFV